MGCNPTNMQDALKEAAGSSSHVPEKKASQTEAFQSEQVTLEPTFFKKMSGAFNEQYMGLSENVGYIPNYSNLIGIMIINHWV